VDTRVLLSGKRSVGALVLSVGLIGLLVISSGCAGTTRASPDVQQGSASAQAPMAPAARLVAQGSTMLQFDPASAQVGVGGVTAVQLRLENVDNLYGIEVHLAFDKDVVQVEDDDPARDGVQIAAGEIPYPDFPVQNMADNLGGRLDYAVVQLSPRPPASGSGVVATIRFRGMRAGTSAIHFTHAKLASPDGLAIPVTWQDGTIVVNGANGPTVTPTPTPGTATPSPTPTPGTATPSPTPTASPPAPPPTTPPGPTSTPAPYPTVTPDRTPGPPLAGGCSTLYVVRTGDTAFSVARRFGVSVGALAAANGLPPSYYMQIGQLLTIPGVPGPIGTSHVVQPGETLYSIARRYGTSVETLAALNRIPHPWHVKLGQTLLICPP
jgi:LysM repeat protein